MLMISKHFLSFFISARESRGWELLYTTPPLERVPQCIALNARVTATSLGDKLLAAVLGKCLCVHLLGKHFCFKKFSAKNFSLKLCKLDFILIELFYESLGNEIKIWSCSPQPRQLGMYMYVFVHLYLCVCMCMYTYTCTYGYLCVSILCQFVCVVHVCVYIYVCIYMYVWMCVICICIHIIHGFV